MNVISPSSTCSWINILVDPGTTFQSNNQNWEITFQEISVLGLGASTLLLISYHFPQILGIIMGRVRFRGRDWVKSVFLDSTVDPGSTKYIDPGTCLTWKITATPTEPDFTKCDMFLDQHLCWPWNNIVINQSDLKNQFIVFVKFRLTISVWCLYISVIHLSFPLILGITHG